MTKRQETRTAHPGRSTRLAAGTAMLLATVLLTGCGGEDAGESAPQKVDGTAAPAGSDAADGGDGADGEDDGNGTKGSGGEGSGSGGEGSGSDDGKATGGNAATSPGGGDGAGSDGSQGEDGAASARACHTSDLKASVGRNRPGAGQENFPLVLTNDSGHTCTVHGFPGLAFVNSEGEQVSLDPRRTEGEKETVTLAPGSSAWAPLSFSNPEMTGVPTVTPAAVKITPPDEKAALRADWSGGPVTRTGKASVPTIGPLSAGTGP